ncbi:MAG: HNH endonuclease [Deltaproteobacteria bacterium]|nr:HNH endonuclease [Deltaproteobacteria bacterium]
MPLTVDSFTEKLYDLNVGLIGDGRAQHERPHKPAMLLAVLDLFEAGEITEGRVEWSAPLRERFSKYLGVVKHLNDQNTPQYPFFHLRSEGFWHPREDRGAAGVLELAGPPTVAQFGSAWAELDPDVTRLLGTPHNRRRIRAALVTRYFPLHGDALARLAGDPGVVAEDDGSEGLDEYRAGRTSAFRRIVLGHYDNQCCACGLRLEIRGHKIVDAAHVIPFAESRNDHPSNGMALCKNHHWAMDRALIAPAPDGRWRASPLLDPRRSSGERDLTTLDGQSLLLPKDHAYRPSPEGLEWRSDRLLGA